MRTAWEDLCFKWLIDKVNCLALLPKEFSPSGELVGALMNSVGERWTFRIPYPGSGASAVSPAELSCSPRGAKRGPILRGGHLLFPGAKVRRFYGTCNRPEFKIIGFL